MGESVSRLNSMLPVAAFHARRYAIPVIVVLAIGALAAVSLYLIRSLIGRVWPPLTAEQLYDQGMEAFQTKDYSKAIELLKSAWRQTKDDLPFEAKILVPLAESYLKEADLQEVDSSQKTKLLNEAFNHFDFAAGCKPLDQNLSLRIYVGKAAVYAQQNLHREAVTQYNSALTIPIPNHAYVASLQFQRGRCWFALKDWRQAIPDFTQALKCSSLKPNERAQNLLFRSTSYRLYRQPEKALEDVIAALKLNPDHTTLLGNIYFEKGMIHAQKNDHFDAIGAFSLALDCVPIDPLLRAEIVCERGFSAHHLRLANAQDDFKEAVSLDPKLQAVIQKRLAAIKK